MAGLKLKHNDRARVLSGHPWVFAGEVQKLPPASADGQALELRDSGGRPLGSGLVNTRSQILWRRFSRKREELDDAVLERLIKNSIDRRKGLKLGRLVWSESDMLPGLVIDRYEDAFSVQTLTLGMDQRLEKIRDILLKLLKPRLIVERNEVPVRALEGLPERNGVLHGEAAPFRVKAGKIEYQIDLLAGQKTGMYLDQLQEHLAVATMASGKRILDAFCNQGGFALQCAAAGAEQVHGVDISEEAIGSARENAERNGLSKIDFRTANVFDFLHTKNVGKWDVIILDPPSFARGKARLAEAHRGYKEINLRALQNLEIGGRLATYSCSHHITTGMFLNILTEAARDARKDVHIVRHCHQPPDHPVLVGMPESEYLKGFILEVVE